MRMRSVFSKLLLFLELFIVHCNNTANTCPSELSEENPKRLLGYRVDNETCISYVKIDATKWSESIDYHNLWHTLCNPVQGRPYLVFKKDDISLSWITQDINITSLSGWFTTNINKTHEWICWTIWYCYMHTWDVHGFFDYKSDHLTMQQLESYIYLLRSTWNWIKDHKTHPYLAQTVMADQYITDWNYRFTRTFSPHNPYLYLHGIENGEVIIKVPIIASNISSDPGRPHYVACKHVAFKNCIHEIVTTCIYNRDLKKWIDKMVVVTQQRDELFGLSCPIVDLESISKPCEPACKGQWSAYTTEPEVKCDKVVLQRFRPALATDQPCNFPSLTCCVDEKEIIYDYACSDFAVNSNINLKLLGCLNNQKLRNSSSGHLKCACSRRFSGIRCEIDICQKRCNNVEDCLPLTSNRAICICKVGFSGEKCETIKDVCGHNGYCQNGGTCQSKSGLYGAHCICPSKFGGESCERKAGNCEPNSCSSHGVCYNDTVRKSFKCSCRLPYVGDDCSRVATAAMSTIETSYALLISVVIPLVLFLTFITIVVVKNVRNRKNIKRKNKKKQEKTSRQTKTSSRRQNSDVGSTQNLEIDSSWTPVNESVSATEAGMLGNFTVMIKKLKKSRKRNNSTASNNRH